MQKIYLLKAKSCILSYRSYKNFKNVRFIGDLRSVGNAKNVILKKMG